MKKSSFCLISGTMDFILKIRSICAKDITIETGYTLKAPLFIKEGDDVVITTRDGKYFGRG